MPRLIQASFARGEIGPELYGRVDVAAYAVALRTALNVAVHSYGGASNRAGLKFIAPCKTHTGTPQRLITFKYNDQDTYVLEHGDYYMRVIREDGQVLEAAKTITGVTQATPAVVTSAAHGYTNGDQVYVQNVAGMTELNGRWFTVANVAANTFELTDQVTGANINSTGYTAYASGGTASKVYEIATPYAVDDLLNIKFVQSANVMTLTHTSYDPRELSRVGHDNWSLDVILFKPNQEHPTNVQVTAVATGAVTYHYKVTATNADTDEESLAGLDSVNVVLSSATATNPVVVTAAAHGLVDGDIIEIYGFAEMTQVNDREFEVANATTNTFELLNEDGTTYAAEVTGGTANQNVTTITNGAATPNNTITFNLATGAEKYSVYRYENGLFGWVGDTEDLSFTDNNIVPDLSITPPKYSDPFFGAGNKPATVSYYEQRRVFGQTINKPDTTFYSVTGSARNMSHSSPRQPDDAITATLNSLEVNAIRHFVPGNDLMCFTSGSEWRINAGSEAAFSAETLRQKPQSSWGCSEMRPLVIGDKTLYVTENNSYVRSLGYELTIDGYKGNDMTVFSPHLFRNYQAVDWAITTTPDPVAITVRADGYVCALTFNPEQDVVGWTRWRTKGKFKRVASARPSSADVDVMPYFVVERKVNGNTVRYIERLASRRFSDVRDCFFVDCGLSYDAPVAITGATCAYPVVVTATAHGFANGAEIDVSDIVWEPTVDEVFNEDQPAQLNGSRFFVAEAAANTFQLVSNEGRVDISGATQANPVVLTSTAHGLSDGDVIGVFNVLGMTELNGRTYKVANATTNTLELNTLADAAVDGTGYTAYSSGGTIYPAVDGSAFNAYDEGGNARSVVSTVGGLWHLEGAEVIALADGDVVENLTVANGAVTLPRKYSRVHVGLRYVADIETLDPEAPQGTMQGKDKRVPWATLRMKDTRGILIGGSSADLTEMKQRDYELMGEPTRLLTGDKEVPLFSDWDQGGRVFIRQIYPLPLTLTAVVPFLDVGDDDE